MNETPIWCKCIFVDGQWIICEPPEIDKLREENNYLHAKLVETQRERNEMIKVAQVIQRREFHYLEELQLLRFKLAALVRRKEGNYE